MKGRAIFIALLILGGLLILVDQVGLPSGEINFSLGGLWNATWIKWTLGVLVVLAFLIFWIWIEDTSTPSTSTPKRISSLIMRWSVTILLGIAAIWIIWTQVFPFVRENFGPSNSWVQNQPTVTVVNNGFHRHDAKFPKTITPRPLDRKVKPDVIYDAFEVKKGDLFRVSFSRPIQLRIKGPGSTGFATFKTPNRYRATNSGLIQIRSETGGNHVRVAPST